MSKTHAGKFWSISDPDEFPADYPMYMMENTESWTATDDILVPPHYEFALFDSALTARSYSLVVGSRGVRTP